MEEAKTLQCNIVWFIYIVEDGISYCREVELLDDTLLKTSTDSTLATDHAVASTSFSTVEVNLPKTSEISTKKGKLDNKAEIANRKWKKWQLESRMPEVSEYIGEYILIYKEYVLFYLKQFIYNSFIP